ncbi:TetR family transcriptional regulator [Streptomyces sp. 150FB]|uniref:TetR/AcrR family transcriptional regulator n=1 Tax=Streptomyces sp. 150FB TaxID=1576605 RepID=UPI000588F8DC|nr:TetR/AcrR family transcriptional regulator [Streptomyces sp. 150FB]KIF78818.1 TetR family transcriptional regulator [Streptomyces sp. 150FB]
MPADKQQEPFPSVWTRPQRQRREQPALSRNQIVAVALQLLDADGIGALSMRKLGSRLNAGATSMYSHVANKDELIELVVDEVYGEVDVPAPGDPAQWRSNAVHCARSLRSALLRHPWIVSVLGEAGVAYLGPNLMRVTEGLIAVFERAGFSLEEADKAVNTVVAYVIGISIGEAAWLTTLARSGRSEEEWLRQLWPAAELAVRAHPRLRELYTAQRDQPPAADRDDSFEDGLACVLDGLEFRLTRAAGN